MQVIRDGYRRKPAGDVQLVDRRGEFIFRLAHVKVPVRIRAAALAQPPGLAATAGTPNLLEQGALGVLNMLNLVERHAQFIMPEPAVQGQVSKAHADGVRERRRTEY